MEYLKASDESNLSKDKRHFNIQSTLRNRFFQDVTKLLRSLNVEVESLVMHRLNFEQIVISSIKKSNHTHLYKCIEYDQKLLALYGEALALHPSTSFLRNQQESKSSRSRSEGVITLRGFIGV